MATPAQIIERALKKSGVLGVGQTASAEDTNDALADLNDLVAQWRRKRWLTYCLETHSLPSTGALRYSVGPGGDFDIARPDRIESAYIRQPTTNSNQPVDYYLKIIAAREDYNRITVKNLGTLSQILFYESSFPLGYVYPYPVPKNIYELFISVKVDLPAFVSLTTAIQLPEEYSVALLWNLAKRLRPGYQLPPDPQINDFARLSLNIITEANAQIPSASLPTPLVRGGLGYYNIFSDTSGTSY